MADRVLYCTPGCLSKAGVCSGGAFRTRYIISGCGVGGGGCGLLKKYPG
jgi:uncharacterized membrane protein